jgi:hypothetical protein
MADPRVAVYIDFDNIVISRYDQLFGSGAWRKDNARDFTMDPKSKDPVSQRLLDARVDIGAILAYATSFGSVTVTRAYADWSATANASYKQQLVDSSVDLTQLFNVSGTKNGADIRLAVDVIDDLFRFDSISDVLIVAGDSDYIPLVTRCKRMGRQVVGLGIDGSTSEAFKKACNVFTVYDDVPGLPQRAPVKAPTERAPQKQSVAKAAAPKPELLVQALELVEKSNGEDWQTNSEVKNQMMRLDSTFNQKALGFSTFSKFLQSRADAGVIEINPDAEPNHRRLRLPEN